ncbi:MAG: pitrilysin family protein [Dehalococcoidia bacterium]|nr:pitrilysin family protein [Dehalococcoidia bacterium]
MHRKTTLDNGLRIVSATIPHVHSVSVAVIVGAGSRYERPEQAGISHFIEHLCFKGTKRRPTSKEISEAIEGVGGMLNGGTDKELTIYWCKVAQPHFAIAVDILADMLSHSTFNPEEIEKERQVIIEEINASFDSPQYRVDLLLDEVMWPDQPLGRDVAGTKATVARMARKDMLAYMSRQYVANNAVVSVAGDVTHRDVVAGLEKCFGHWKPDSRQEWFPVDASQTQPRLRVEERDTEQAHLCLAVPGLSLGHPDRFTLDLLSAMLGEGMSSRLFLEIREKKGLAYAINSCVDHYLDTGAFTIYAGVDPKQVPATVTAILAELNRIKRGVPADELKKTKEYCKGRMLLRMEDTRTVSSWIGGQEFLLGDILTVEQVISKIEAIQARDIVRIADQLFVDDMLNLAVVGPVDEKSLDGLLRL